MIDSSCGEEDRSSAVILPFMTPFILKFSSEKKKGGKAKINFCAWGGEFLASFPCLRSFSVAYPALLR